MPDMGAGSRLYQKGNAVATLTVTPLPDRAAIVRRILLTKVSASDTWIISVGGQEVGRYVENTTGHQQLLSAPTGSFPSNNDIFSFCENVLNDPLVYPIPNGMSLVIASVGGATADIAVAFEEYPPVAVPTTIYNHPKSNVFYGPLYFSRAAAVAAAGEAAFDTQQGLGFVPGLFPGGTFPQGWQIDILGLFLEGAGVNTYSGSADHRSITDHIGVQINGQQYFSRTIADGIPLVGTASAAGSANTVFGADYTPFPPFQQSDADSWLPLDPSLTVRPGATTSWKLGVTGDVTGGASYATILQVALCRIREI